MCPTNAAYLNLGGEIVAREVVFGVYQPLEEIPCFAWVLLLINTQKDVYAGDLIHNLKMQPWIRSSTEKVLNFGEPKALILPLVPICH